MTDDLPDLPDPDDAFMRAAFDPSFKFEPVVKPAEHELADIEGAAALAETTCPHCEAAMEPHYHEGRLRSVGVTHQVGCPDYHE